MSLLKVVFVLVATSGLAAQACAVALNSLQSAGGVAQTLVFLERVRMSFDAAATARPTAAPEWKSTPQTAPVLPMALSRLAGNKTTMLQAGQILGWLSALMLLAAFLAWFKPSGRWLGQQRGRSEPVSTSGDTAPRLLLSAVGLSTLAAILAVSGCLFK